jgi:hypothetical protein
MGDSSRVCRFLSHAQALFFSTAPIRSRRNN